MKNIGVFISENFQFLVVKFSMYLNRRVFVMAVKNHILHRHVHNKVTSTSSGVG